MKNVFKLHNYSSPIVLRKIVNIFKNTIWVLWKICKIFKIIATWKKFWNAMFYNSVSPESPSLDMVLDSSSSNINKIMAIVLFSPFINIKILQLWFIDSPLKNILKIWHINVSIGPWKKNILPKHPQLNH